MVRLVSPCRWCEGRRLLESIGLARLFPLPRRAAYSPQAAETGWREVSAATHGTVCRRRRGREPPFGSPRIHPPTNRSQFCMATRARATTAATIRPSAPTRWLVALGATRARDRFPSRQHGRMCSSSAGVHRSTRSLLRRDTAWPGQDKGPKLSRGQVSRARRGTAFAIPQCRPFLFSYGGFTYARIHRRHCRPRAGAYTAATAMANSAKPRLAAYAAATTCVSCQPQASRW